VGELWIVATPIGNLGDLTPRAREALGRADAVAAEDTRVTGAMLSSLGIHARLFSCHKFNELGVSEKIVEMLDEGQKIALVTDAGTPCVSDPGNAVALAAAKAGHTVTAFPGASAAVTGLSLSGLCPGPFTFWGFPPRGAKDLRDFMEKLVQSGVETHVLYDSPHRVQDTLGCLVTVCAQAQVCLCNDLTKFYEKIYRGTPEEVLEQLRANPSAQKGEYTLILYLPIKEKESAQPPAYPPEAELVRLMTGGLSLREAREALQKERPDWKRRDLYQASLRLKRLWEDNCDA